MDENIIREKLDDAITNIANGNPYYIETLYAQLHKQVFFLAYTITKDYHLASDIMQETFLRIEAKADKYSTGTNPKAWILSITRNIALNYLEKSKKEIVSVGVGEDSDLDMQTEDETDNVIFQIDFERLIDKFDVDSGQILLLRIFSNMKLADIAKILEINQNTVRIKYHRALKQLKRNFMEE